MSSKQRATFSAQDERSGERAIELSLRFFVCLAAAGLVLAGCATSGGDRSQARANTGYVDIHGESAEQLVWGVELWGEHKQEFQRIFTSWAPAPNGIVRLALRPGHQRLRISCLNRGTTGPVEAEMEVENGRITPVSMGFKPAGSAEVQTKKTSVGGTLYGRYGRRTQFTSEQEAIFELSAAAERSVPYQREEGMPYAQKAGTAP